MQSIHESWVIDIGSHNESMLAPLEPAAPLRVREFDLQQAYVVLCLDCGRWVVEQTMIGEELRYALQLVGSLRRFSEPRDIPIDALAHQILLRRLRLQDLTPRTVERLVAEFLRSEWRDCEVEHVGSCGGAGDHGVDLVLIRHDVEYLVQVKHHPLHRATNPEKREGVRPIRELNGVLFRDGKTRGVLITTGAGYTRGAVEEVELAKRCVPGYISWCCWIAST